VLRAQGAEITEGVNVTGLRPAGKGWRLQTDGDAGGDLEAHRVVIAAGAATEPLLRSLGVRLPLVGAKGYSIDVHGAGEPPRSALYLSEAKIGLSPFMDGVRIAGVFELPARGDSVSPRRIRQLIQDTAGYMSGWQPPAAEAAGPGWAGLRPATPDGLPLLGPITSAPGVLVATGHGMLGVTLAPATGAVVADLITSQAEPAWLAPFRPDRRL
jgi:D-amino-acid dehydrogenase